MGTANTKQPVLEINGQGLNNPINDINLIEKVDSVQIARGHKRDFILLSLRIERKFLKYCNFFFNSFLEKIAILS